MPRFFRDNTYAARKVSLSDRVSSFILELIQKDQLKPGDSLPSENTIGQMSGASRTAVREALRSLEARRIIDMSPGKRACVAELDSFALANFIMNGVSTEQITVSQIHDVRRTVETRIAELAAFNRTEEQADALLEHAQIMSVNIHDSEVVMLNDMEFHSKLAEASRNPVYGVMMGAFSKVIRSTWPITWHCRTTDAERCDSVEIHLEIARAVKQKNAGLAADRMTKHFDADLKPLARSGIVYA